MTSTTMPNSHTDVPDPTPILDLLEGFRRSKVMFTALTLGLFDRLADRAATAAELAAELPASGDALERLLDACVALDLLTRSKDAEGSYTCSPLARTYLASDGPRRLTGYARYSDAVLYPMWGHLEDAVRAGTHRWTQTFGLEGPLFSHFFRTESDQREFLLGMHGLGQQSSTRIVQAFDLGRFRRLVDLGGATGHLAMAACARYPHLRAAVFDLPGTQALAGELIAAAGLTERIERIAGDFFADPLPEADLYTLGRILHDWTEDKIARLLRKIFDHLPKGGALLVAEKLLDDDKRGPLPVLIQSLNMLVVTEGKERTLPEYTALLRAAGFTTIEGRRTDGLLDAVLAVKE